MRDDFSEDVKRIVANRVNNRCSNPECCRPTSGPQIDPTKALNIGVAAHITAASVGGPRYDPSLSAKERKHASNAIWLCQNCAKLIDNDPARFRVSLLRQWKQVAESSALALLVRAATSFDSTLSSLSPEEMDILRAAADKGEIYLSWADQTNDWVSVGPQNFRDENDPAVAAMYVEALASLQRRRLVKHDEDELYVLTGTGFKVARAFTAVNDPTDSA